MFQKSYCSPPFFFQRHTVDFIARGSCKLPFNVGKDAGARGGSAQARASTNSRCQVSSACVREAANLVPPIEDGEQRRRAYSALPVALVVEFLVVPSI